VSPGEAVQEVDQFIYEVEQNFDEAMGDDLNISSALAAIFSFVRKLNPHISQGSLSESQKETALDTMMRLDCVLKLMHCVEPEMDDSACRLLEARDKARRKRQWDEADRLRQELLDLGIKVIDTPGGTRWKPIE
jgi:cysteinyl-tRNA synthetase